MRWGLDDGRFAVRLSGAGQRFHPSLSLDAAPGGLGIDPQQEVEVVIHQSETGDGDGEDRVQFLDPLIESFHSIEFLVLDEEKHDANTARDAVAPTSNAGIDDFGAWLGPHENLPSAKNGFDSNQSSEPDTAAATMQCISLL